MEKHAAPRTRTRKRDNLATMLSSSLGVAVFMLVAAIAKRYWGVDITM